jgi:diaminopimelate epimerase
MDNHINFIKMQALGNDFVLMDNNNSSIIPHPHEIQALSDRHLGIGFDQLLIISPSDSPDFDYYYRVFNADGSEVAQCGNGARCAAKYIHQYLSPLQKTFVLQTHTTQLKLKILENHLVSLQLPPPSFHPQDLPFLSSRQDQYQIDFHGQKIEFHAVSVGNPHIVILIQSEEELLNMDIKPIGQYLENHTSFPERCNVNFAYIKSPNQIILRVWERGSGETLACGSGALATACVGMMFYHLQPSVHVVLKGGQLKIDWPDMHSSIEQIGPATEVFQGRIKYKTLE